MKAGLLDRAERPTRRSKAARSTPRRAWRLLSLHERSRHWRSAADVAQKLERSGTGSFASRIAHYWCELAIEADAQHQDGRRPTTRSQRARTAAPRRPARPLVLAGQRAAHAATMRRRCRPGASCMPAHPAPSALVARDYATARCRGRQRPRAGAPARCTSARPRWTCSPRSTLLDPATRCPARAPAQPPAAQPEPVGGARAAAPAAGDSLSGRPRRKAARGHRRAAKPLQRYRCAACGFEAQHYFWQCPGCLNWDSYPPQRLEDL
jgi:hypothetical protein